MSISEDAPKSESPPSVSFFQLFRYATRFEIFLNIIGAIVAFIAGAAQPLMTLLFGGLVQTFAIFSSASRAYLQDSHNATVVQQFDSAAALLRANAGAQALYIVYIGIGLLIFTYIYMLIWVHTGDVNSKRVREKYLQAVLRQDITYFDSVGAGEVATRIQTDTHHFQNGISEKVTIAINNSASFITGYVLAYARCWRLALAVSAILPCMLIATHVMTIFIFKYMVLSLGHFAESGTIAEETISTIRTAHAFGIQKSLLDLYDKHNQSAHTAESKGAIGHGIGIGVMMFIAYGAYALAFQFGTTLINEGHANSGQVVNVVLAILIGSFSMTQIGGEIRAITLAQAAATKLFDTIERIPDIDSSDPSGIKPQKVDGEISLENVKFSYSSRPDVPVVKDLNITFKAGETTALVGASGSGKSTVISLVERFYDPLSGSVKLDGIDIRELNLKWLRSQIGLVSQEPTLFATTIRGNVAHGLINTPYEDLSEDEKFKLIKEACIKSNAEGFINKLPNGYDTMVGERGFLLSGGQKQRIAIARAIVSDPRVLLLDEATSALDTQSEGVVQDALEKAAAGRTTITIAHRLSTIKDADCIYVMGDGLVLEKGTHAELMANSTSAYSRLVQAQKLREVKKTEDDEEDAEGDALDNETNMEKVVEKEIPLGRKETIQSIGSDLVRNRNEAKRQKEINEDGYSGLYLMKRIGSLYPEGLRKYVVGSFFAAVAGMAYPVMGIVFAHALSGFNEPDRSVRQRDGNMSGVWFLLIAIISGLAMGLNTYMFATVAATLSCRLRSISFKALLRQDIEFFDKDENRTGTLTSNLSVNPEKVNGLAGVTFGAIITGLFTLIGGSAIGLAYQYKLSLVGMAFMPILMSTGYIRLRVVVLKEMGDKKAYETSAQMACEATAAIRTVASLSREDDCIRLYRSSLEVPIKQSRRKSLWSSLLYAFSQAMPLLVIPLVFWYGAVLMSRLECDTTTVFVAIMSTTFGTIQISNLFSYVPDMSAARGASAAIIKLIDSKPDVDAHSITGKNFEGKDVQGEVMFENVHFRYPTRPGVRVLRGLSFAVKPGTFIALVGASGCGKSTVIQLMQRFYEPLAGRILLDGEPINEYNVQEYRKQMALVSQEPTLYAGTIRFNILLGANKPHSEVTEKEIEAACRDANILDFIQSLPDGFDTQVGGKGSQLSGGQKQRIAIARALLRNPRVLLLDEATSALDSNSEKVVQAALDQASKGRTTIAIAHRLSTIQNANCIYFIKDGRVSEAGTHDELLSLRGDYYAHVQLQMLTT